MKIAIDLMGGDFAPEVVIEGVKKYYLEQMKESFNSEIAEKEVLFLVGIKENFENSFFQEEIKLNNEKKNNQFENDYFIIHKVICNDYIKMDDKPLTLFQGKNEGNLDYTIIKSISLLKEKKADIMYSAGNSGAVIYTALNLLGLKKQNQIPVIATFIPSFVNIEGYSMLLDVGASGNKPIDGENLLSIAKLGYEFFNSYKGNKGKTPKLGLLNIGSEDWKGTKEHRLAHESFKNKSSTTNYNYDFIGNIEADKVLYSEADIIVADGFTGNIVLKLLESFSNLITKLLDGNKKENIENPILSKFSYEGTGGAPLLGFEEKIVIGHGKSSVKAIHSGLKFCKKYTT